MLASGEALPEGLRSKHRGLRSRCSKSSNAYPERLPRWNYRFSDLPRRVAAAGIRLTAGANARRRRDKGPSVGTAAAGRSRLGDSKSTAGRLGWGHRREAGARPVERPALGTRRPGVGPRRACRADKQGPHDGYNLDGASCATTAASDECQRIAVRARDLNRVGACAREQVRVRCAARQPVDRSRGPAAGQLCRSSVVSLFSGGGGRRGVVRAWRCFSCRAAAIESCSVSITRVWASQSGNPRRLSGIGK